MEVTIELLNAVIEAYEQNVWSAVNKGNLGGFSMKLANAQIYERPRGTRQIVIPVVHKIPRIQLSSLLPEVGQLIMNHQNLPDEVLVIGTVEMSNDVRQTFIEMMQSAYQVKLGFIQGDELFAISEFEKLLEVDKQVSFEDLDNTQKLLYDLLAEGQNVSDIKSSLVCSVIVFLLDENGPLTNDKLLKLVQDKLGKDVGGIQQEIMFLRKYGRIEPSKANKSIVNLTDSEKRKVSEAKAKMLKEERAFFAEFTALLEEFGIRSNQKELFAILRQMYKEHCGLKLDQHNNGKSINANQRGEKAVVEFHNFLKTKVQNSDKEALLINRLKDLCANNRFLSRVGASESFLSLYRSQKLEQYIGGKHKFVFLDTPVFVFYFCSKTGLLQGYTDWQDHGYRSTIHMMSLQFNKKLDVNFYISGDYVGEAVGELKKALRMAWFAEKHKFAIPFETSNTFFNYYYFLLKEGHLKDNRDVKDFASFVSYLGFGIVDPEHVDFDKQATNTFINSMRQLGLKLFPSVQIPSGLYNDTLKEYESELLFNNKEKTPEARKNDVRQCIRLAQMALEEADKGKDFYFASWDYSTIDLRKWLMNRDSSMFGRYSIYNPGRIASKFSLSNFNIDSKSISDELFFYADESYNLSEKIRELYDDVIIPLFGYQERKDLQTVKFVLELQKQYLSQANAELTDVELPTKLPLEIIFNEIRQKVSERGHSEQELSTYLNDTVNLTYFKSFFTDAFDKVAKKMKITSIVTDFNAKFEEYLRATSAGNTKIPL